MHLMSVPGFESLSKLLKYMAANVPVGPKIQRNRDGILFFVLFPERSEFRTTINNVIFRTTTKINNVIFRITNVECK